MKKTILVIGAGLVGSFVANKLAAEGLAVYVVDPNPDARAKCNVPDLQKFADIEAVKGQHFDLAVNAVPGHLGYNTLNRLVNILKFDVVDFSFMPEDPTTLDNFHNNICLTDFGVAPGICHIMVEKLYQKLGADSAISIEVGGLPKLVTTEYKAPFSPVDVVEEYTRPARYVANYKVEEEDPFKIKYPYQDDPRLLGFISDGLRSLLNNIPVRFLTETTLRGRDHFNEMKLLKDYGFFKPENLESTCRVLVDRWAMPDDFRDQTIMKVVGASYDKKITSIITLHDVHDGDNHSMARATGLPVVAGVKYILENRDKLKPGIYAPEIFSRNNSDFYDYVIGYLKENGVVITEEEK